MFVIKLERRRRCSLIVLLSVYCCGSVSDSVCGHDIVELWNWKRVRIEYTLSVIYRKLVIHK